MKELFQYTAPEVIVMLDIESLSLGVRPVVTQLAMVSFATDNPDEIVRKHVIDLPIQPQLDLPVPRKVSGSTLAWWLGQPHEARLNFMNAADGDFDELAALLRSIPREFAAMTVGLAKDQYRLMSRGPQFDVVAVETLLQDVGLEPNWYYASVSDLRTVMDQAQITTSDVPRPDNWTEHSAYWDCRYQIACWAEATRRIQVREPTNIKLPQT
jgi:hypothetical protein